MEVPAIETGLRGKIGGTQGECTGDALFSRSEGFDASFALRNQSSFLAIGGY